MNVLLRLEAAPRRQEFPQEQKDWMLLPLKAPYEIRIDMRTFDYPSRWEAKSRKRSGLVTPATEAESNRSRLEFRGMGDYSIQKNVRVRMNGDVLNTLFGYGNRVLVVVTVLVLLRPREKRSAVLRNLGRRW